MERLPNYSEQGIGEKGMQDILPTLDTIAHIV
jgi:hypothetical protein